MSLLAELFEGLETSTAEIDMLKTERIRATDPAPRFHHSQNVAATTSSAGPEGGHYKNFVVKTQHSGEPQQIVEISREPQRPVHTAATATFEWIAARDQYVSHLMACRACYAPTGRHCAAGAGLRQQYDQTPMERAQ